MGPGSMLSVSVAVLSVVWGKILVAATVVVILLAIEVLFHTACISHMML